MTLHEFARQIVLSEEDNNAPRSIKMKENPELGPKHGQGTIVRHGCDG
jgi:hypothetical protein